VTELHPHVKSIPTKFPEVYSWEL